MVPAQPPLTMSASLTVELAKQRIQDKLAAQLKQEKNLIEEKKRDMEFTQQLEIAKISNLKSDELKNITDDDEDPLDAYMKEITTTQTKVNLSESTTEKVKNVSNTKKTLNNEIINQKGVIKEQTNKVTIMVGIARSLTDVKTKEKGHIMEQDIDGLEYASDEEAVGSLNDELNFETVQKMKTKSEMVFTDHSKVYYRSFKKDFYVEVPEISKMTNEGIRYEFH